MLTGYQKGKIRCIITFLGIVFISTLHAQKADIYTDLNDFLGDFAEFISSSCDSNSNDSISFERWNKEFKDKFYGNPKIFNECNGINEPLAIYFKNYLFDIRKFKPMVWFEFSLNKGIHHVKGNEHFALVDRVAKLNDTSISEITYKVNFTYEKDVDPARIKIIGMEKSDEYNRNKKYINALCPPRHQQINPVFSLSLIGVGTASVASSFYFKRQSDKLYSTYISTFPSQNSENLYFKANKNRHTWLILEYAGSAIITAGIINFTRKLFNRRRHNKMQN